MKEQITLGDRRYTVKLERSALSHLCTGVEISNFELFVEEYNSQFGSYTSIPTSDIESNEFDLLTYMFAKLVKESIQYADNGKYALLAMNTGNASQWEYTLVQRDKFTPILERIQDKTSMILYNEDGYYSEYIYDDAEPNEAYVELTMFTIPIASVNRTLSTDGKALMDAIYTKPVPEQSITLTEDAIKKYLRGQHAA